MKLTRRTFLISSTAAAVAAALPSLPKAAAINAGSGRSVAGTLPVGRYAVTAEIEFAAAPVTDDLLEFYWGPPGTSAINSQLIGIMMSSPERSSIGFVGTFEPGCENGQLIIVNKTSQSLEAKVEVTELQTVIENEGATEIHLQFGKTIKVNVRQKRALPHPRPRAA